MSDPRPDTTAERRRTVRAALERGAALLDAAGVEEALRDAELLLARALGTDRVRLHADPPPLLAGALERYDAWIGQRAARHPVAHILGEAEFHSLLLEITPDVLVPRPETEHLVDRALQLLAAVTSPVVVDVGTGSGCIAIALLTERPDARVAALDLSAEALAVARRNGVRHGVGERMLAVRGDMLEAVRGPVDLVVSNPPYVALDETVDPECLREPHGAVFAGVDALVPYDRVARGAAAVLRPGGFVLVELPGDRSVEVSGLFRGAGLEPQEPLADLAGRPRVLAARRGS